MSITKTLPIVLGVIIVALLSVLIFLPGRNTTIVPVASSTDTGTVTLPPPIATSTTGSTATATLIAYKSLRGLTANVYLAPNTRITSPLTITGNVPSGWAFEASFLVKLVDANGAEMGEGLAFVPNWTSTTTATDWFSVSISFAKPPVYITNGTLILAADDPSGLPQYEDEVRIPVRF
jgi:hypothetical protein